LQRGSRSEGCWLDGLLEPAGLVGVSPGGLGDEGLKHWPGYFSVGK
jgi:hypothetical protein